jgi:carbon dioxide concentrating mechanism protein CcmN
MIYLPPPQPVLNKDIRISGDVEIHPTASLAPGVILQAAPNNRIVIGADVCIGMGVIINACIGSIEIDNSAILGAGVLIIGTSKIGSHACIGTSTTIFQANVAAMAVIEPGSIIGDSSRQINLNQNQKNSQNSSTDFQAQNYNHHSQKTSSNNNSTTEPQPKVTQNSQTEQHFASNPQVEKIETSVEPTTETKKIPVVGQVYINELLVTLFPHKQSQADNSANLK